MALKEVAMVTEMETKHEFDNRGNLSPDVRFYSGSRKVQDAIPSHIFHNLIPILLTHRHIYKDVLIGFKIQGMHCLILFKYVSCTVLDEFVKADS